MKRTFTPKLGIIAVIIFLVFSAILLVSKRDENTSVTSSASGSPNRQANQTGEIGEYYDGGINASMVSSPVPRPADIKEYTYPTALTKVSSATKLEMESTASAQLITDWYENKIKELNFNAKSFSETSTNGNILNILTAAKPGEKIDITIKKDQKASKVLITVDRL